MYFVDKVTLNCLTILLAVWYGTVLFIRIGPDGADFPTSTFMLEYEDQTNRLVESLWKASCLPEQIEATANTLARSPEQQLEVFGRKPELKGCLPVMQSFSITHDGMSAL